MPRRSATQCGSATASKRLRTPTTSSRRGGATRREARRTRARPGDSTRGDGEPPGGAVRPKSHGDARRRAEHWVGASRTRLQRGVARQAHGTGLPRLIRMADRGTVARSRMASRDLARVEWLTGSATGSEGVWAPRSGAAGTRGTRRDGSPFLRGRRRHLVLRDAFVSYSQLKFALSLRWFEPNADLSLGRGD